MSFKIVKKKVSDRFNLMLAAGLYVVDYDRDKIWNAYLQAFPEETRQEHNCNCCKAFIRQVGGAITIDPTTLKLGTVWDLADVPEEYAASVKAVADYVRSCTIAGLFYHENDNAGVDRNKDGVRNVIWEHFHVKIPKAIKDVGGSMLRKSAALRDGKSVLKRSLDEFSIETVDLVLELIAQDSIYKGPEYKAQLEFLRATLEGYGKTPEADRDAFAWYIAQLSHDSFNKMRNHAIGKLLIDLTEGKPVDDAVRSFENITAPSTYKRSSAVVTPRMLETAKANLQELGLISALDRRRLDSRDLTPENALFVHRPKPSTKDVFAEIAKDAKPDPKTLSKVEEISITDFIEKILPLGNPLRVLFEHHHLGNLATLVGPVDPDANNLMKWDNSFGWSYTGGVADSIKERVKTAGGKVDGWMRISLAWRNYDDLDLHLRGQGDHVYYNNRSSGRMGGANLDVDMNAGSGKTREPVENIHIPRQLPPGDYAIDVNQYAWRESNDSGFDLEIESGGELTRFSAPKSLTAGSKTIAMKVTKDGKFTVESDLSRTSSGTAKWGLKTGQWHQVKAITLSPNHWTRPIGNKHWFFLLEGCVSDEKTRPFYNEFLVEALTKDRKVTEVLADRIDVAPAEGAELSGLGFSETIRNHVIVEVSGTFKRTLKVNF